MKKETARLARNRAVRKENGAKEQTAVTEEDCLRWAQAGNHEGAGLTAPLAAVLDIATATAMGPCASVGSSVIQGSQSGFDAQSGEGVTKDVWFG